jgi:hypothetical protein
MALSAPKGIVTVEPVFELGARGGKVCLCGYWAEVRRVEIIDWPSDLLWLGILGSLIISSSDGANIRCLEGG